MLPIFDIILVVVILGCFGFIGFYFRPKRGANSEEYFLAGKQMSIVPAALSISVSYFSSAGLTIYQGEIVVFGCPFYAVVLSALITGVVAVCFVLHRLYDSPYLSVFLFLEHRFSRFVRVFSSFIFVSTGGGIRAVIWTDVCQALLMLTFLVLICVKGLVSFESFAEFTTLVSEGQRAKLRFNESSADRYSFQSFTTFFLIHHLYMECVSQPGVQRWKSVKTLTDAKITVILSLIFNGTFSCLVFFTGLVLYAFYAQCTHNEGPFPTSDKISLYFVLKELSSWPGAQGLCLAGLLSGALSTMSSFLNSLAAVTLEDCVKMKFKSLSDSVELSVSKALTAVYGIVSTALIIVASRSGAMAIVQVTAFSISTGPPLGTFFLGMWTKRANALGASLGLVVSVALVTWLSVGSAFYRKQHVPLLGPQCPGNTTSIVGILEQNILAGLPQENVTAERGHIDHVYEVSAFWYSLISFLISFTFGYVFSICTSRFRKVRDITEDDAPMFRNFKEPSESVHIHSRTLEISPKYSMVSGNEWSVKL